jgi:FlaA1/EpsC-like NDP-sugar epimerase
MNPPLPLSHLPPATQLDQPILRQSVKLLLDALLAGLSWWGCQLIFVGEHPPLIQVIGWIALAMAVNLALQLTRQHYRVFGFRDGLRVGGAGLLLIAASAILAVFILPLQEKLTLESVLSASFATSGLWLTLRAFVRARQEWHMDPFAQLEGRAPRISLIVGAGRAGLMIAEELKRHPELGVHVVGFVDDALSKQGIRIQGIPVLGPSQMLRTLIQQEGATQVILAIPSAPGSVIRQLNEAIRSLGVEVKTVPGLFNLLGSQTWKPELRDISIEDLLQREPVSLDQGALTQIYEEAVILITGGGGSIGGELARQVAAFRPARIVLLGRGENSLWETERSLRQLFPNQGLSLELCDIRNRNRMEQVFQRWKPQIVLHAAAHKHVPYLEAHPEEAVENNIFGTQNVIQAALAVGTQTVVNISTDKAVNPTNVLGATKRVAESLVLQAGRDAAEGTRLMSVRFGNVLGSRGSVIPIFKDQIRRGGPLTVTHPDMTRYFMTIPEASQLVLQAAALGDNAQVYVLDMGDPVKIVDLATDMARLSGFTPGQDIDLLFTGIRPGEKLFEELFNTHEQSTTAVHPKVFNAAPEEVRDDLLEEGLGTLQKALSQGEGVRQTEILLCLKRLVPTYSPSPTGLGRYASPLVASRNISGSHPILPQGARRP